MTGPAADLAPELCRALRRFADAVGGRVVDAPPRGVTTGQAWALRGAGLLASGNLVQPDGRPARQWWMTEAGRARLARESVA
jgi:hypothetical protein